MKNVRVKKLTFGSGKPKIAVPIVGETAPVILAAAKEAMTTPMDLLEWRIDFFKDLADIETVINLARQIQKLLEGHPLLITLRTQREGGHQAITADEYSAIYQAIITNHVADLVDIEVLRDPQIIRSLTRLAHANGIKVIMSNHDFAGTPPATTLLQRLGLMSQLDADIVKFAVTPHCLDDVLTILTVNVHFAALPNSQPVIAIGMGQLGQIVRVSGETFGSCVSFGSVRQASAPGQLNVNQLKEILSILHGKEETK